MEIPSRGEVKAGILAFQARERRDAMYKTATFLVRHFWGKPLEMADGLGVLLLTWNQALYRYGSFDFDVLENCITRNFESLQFLRGRDISSHGISDEPETKRLFDEFLAALRVRKDGEGGPRSPVAVSKALHLLAPSFFALWDTEIAKAYGCDYGHKPAEKYISFTYKMKSILGTLDLGSLEMASDKTPLKLLDEYNYSKFTKQWI